MVGGNINFDKVTSFINTNLNRVENALSLGSAVTVVLPIFGIIKSKMGVVQMTAGLAGAIFGGIYGSVTRDWRALDYSVSHILHGAGNFIRGSLESTPFIQTLLNIKIFINGFDADGSDNKWIGYYEHPVCEYEDLAIV